MKKAIVLLMTVLAISLSEATENDLTDGMLQHGVIIRVWASSVAGGESVGHASLQTDQDYISFWPPEEGSTATGYFNTLAEDYTDEEGRDPEITIFLPNPAADSTTSLHQDYLFLRDLLEEGNLRWVLNGQGQKLKNEFTRRHYEDHVRGASLFAGQSHTFGVYRQWAFNCSSLVYNLLLNRQYFTHSPFQVGGLNTCMTPDQIAQSCSLTFLKQCFGDSYRARCEHEMRQRGIDGLMSFQEKYVGYYIFKTVDQRVTLNERFLDDAAANLRSINESSFGIQLMEMFSSMGMSELVSPFLSGNQKK